MGQSEFTTETARVMRRKSSTIHLYKHLISSSLSATMQPILVHSTKLVVAVNLGHKYTAFLALTSLFGHSI
jgi:hypothetical protein